MVPSSLTAPHSSRLLYTLLSLAAHHGSRLFRANSSPIPDTTALSLAKRHSEFDPHQPKYVIFAVLIPILVLMSGVFAGLTLGYMSLDETQLNVLSISGTPKQREYANKIKPIRKNGHLLLVTLLLANMIVNESLPVISDPVLGGGVQSVVVSTVLIVIFAEIIPQSLFTRHGLYLGAKMAGFTKVLIYGMGVIAWPVAKLLEFVLGSHHGIIYRRAELKELIAMHSSLSSHGGDLKRDTVTIIGATLDLQEKVVKQAMTPISDVFMLSIDSKLDYDLLKKICMTGHSRVPVYEEVEVPMSLPGHHPSTGSSTTTTSLGIPGGERMQKVKKIVGILLVKQCVLLDPKDAVPLRKIPLNKVPFVPNNEPLLGILDKFQEGRSHMAIVSRFSVEKAASVKKAVKRGLTQRLRERVGMGDSDSSDDEKDDDKSRGSKGRDKDIDEGTEDEATLKGDGVWEKDFASGNGNGSGRGGRSAFGVRGRSKRHPSRDVEMGIVTLESSANGEKDGKAGGVEPSKSRRTSFQLPRAGMSMSMLEQSMPADAVLGKEGAEEFLQSFDPAVMPLGIITLEDVLEELIGEEIYDEFDPQGAHGDPYVPPAQPVHVTAVHDSPNPSGTSKEHTEAAAAGTKSLTATPVLRPIALKGLNFLRSRSAPPTPHDGDTVLDSNVTAATAYADLGMGTNTPVAPSPTVPASRSHSQSIIEMPTPILGMNDRHRHFQPGPPSVIIEQYNSSPLSIASSLPEVPSFPVGIEGKNRSLPPIITVPATAGGLTVPSPSPLLFVAPVPRTGSPAPSLEAILLERKRRLTGPGGVSPSASPSTPTSTANLVLPVGGGSSSGVARPGTVKGTRFKSSPLGGGDRAGVVVAEKVKEDMDDLDDDEARGFHEGRIPDGKDKAGPDKDKNEGGYSDDW